MAQGDRRAPVLLGTATSITNPMVAAGAGTTVVVGDLIFGFIVEQTTNTLGAASDNLGNTYTALGKTTVGGLTYQAYYSRATVAGSLTQFRVAATASGSNSAVIAAVFEGPFTVSPLDKSPANTTADVTSPFTTPLSTTLAQANEVVICFAGSPGSATWAASAPLAAIVQQATAAIASVRFSNKTVAATTSTSGEFTGTAPATICLGTATFKLETAVGGNASGGTVTATATVPSAATGTGAAVAAGTTATAIASLVPGAATGSTAAGGVTLTATSSLVAGTAAAITSARVSWVEIEAFTPVIAKVSWVEIEATAPAAGATLAAVASLLAGVATGTAQAGGAMLADAASLLAGTATGTAVANGATLTTAASLVAGAATGTAVASGSTLPAAASLIAGAPAGAVSAAGATLTTAASLVAGAASGAAAASGATVTDAASLVAGTASGVAAASGGTATATASLVAGNASGTAAASGGTVAVAVSFLAGEASAEATQLRARVSWVEIEAFTPAAGVTLTATAQIIAGTAAEQEDATAFGATLEATASLIAGTASGTIEIAVITGGRRYIQRREDAVAYGDLLVCRARILPGRVTAVSLLAGRATGGAVAAGNDNIEAVARLIPGTAAGERNFADEELLMIFAEAA